MLLTDESRKCYIKEIMEVYKNELNSFFLFVCFYFIAYLIAVVYVKAGDN